jgi:hypothetical protein
MSQPRFNQYELESLWITSDAIPGVDYKFGDLVRVESGEYAGQTGEVIALLAIDPEPVYLITLPPDEQSVVLRQLELEATGTTTGRTLVLKGS